MRIHLFQLIVALVVLCTAGALLAEDGAPTREEFNSLAKEVESLKSERTELRDALAARGSADLDGDIESYLARTRGFSEPLQSGTNRFVLTGFAWTNFENIEGQDSTFRTAFVPIFLWKISDRILFETEVDFAFSADETEVELAYAQLSFIVNDWLTIAGGKFLTPFGTFWERWHPAWINRMPTMPLVYSRGTGIVSESLIGIQARGGFRVGTMLVNYAAYLANGPTLGGSGDEAGRLEWERNIDNNNSKTFGGRIGVLPIPYVEIGGSLLAGTVGDSGSVNSGVDTLILGIDFWFGREIDALKGYLEVRAEAVWADTDDAIVLDDNDNPFLFENNRRQGWFVQVAWRPTRLEGIAKKLELVVRFDSTQSPGPGELGLDRQRISIGVNYWFLENVPFKFVWFQNTFSEGADQSGVVFQAAVGF